MAKKKFSEVLLAALLEWRKRQTEQRKGVSLNSFASYLGISRPAISLWLSDNQEPRQDSIEAILPALVDLLGPQVYDDLGLARPDPILAHITQNWHRLPLEVQNQIRTIVDQTIDRRPNETQNKHEHSPDRA